MRAIYDLVKMGPTSANQQPARFVWLTEPGGQGQARRAAPARTNARQDPQGARQRDHRHGPRISTNICPTLPARPTAKAWFAGNPNCARYATRSATRRCRARYFIIAARALGLRYRADVGVRQRQGRCRVLRRPAQCAVATSSRRSAMATRRRSSIACPARNSRSSTLLIDLRLDRASQRGRDARLCHRNRHRRLLGRADRGRSRDRVGA